MTRSRNRFCDPRAGEPWPAALAVLCIALAAASGCATQAADPVGPDVVDPVSQKDGDGTPVTVDPDVVSYDDYRDPLMPVNRVVFGFNDVMSRYALIPLGKAYTFIVPDPVEHRVDDFFFNVRGPVYAVNHLLQGKPADSGRNLLRFGINSTIGLLGLVVAGFSSLALSDFVPSALFGLLTAVALVAALVFDLTVHPALLGRIAKRTDPQEHA